MSDTIPPKSTTPLIVAILVSLLGGGGYAFHSADDMPSQESVQLRRIERLLDRNLGKLNQQMELFRSELKGTDENISRNYRRLDDIERVCRERRGR